MPESQTTPRWEQKLENYKQALLRLGQIVNESKLRPLNEFEMDSVIKRFEFTFELSWKLMKSYASYQGIDTIIGSRDAFRWSFENGLITDGENWMNMIVSRNQTSHNYDGSTAIDVIWTVIDVYYPLMLAFCQRMEMRKDSSSK